MAAVRGLSPSNVVISAVIESNADGSETGSAVLPCSIVILPRIEMVDKYQISNLPHNDGNVDSALRILSQRQLTWSELYKLLEIVKADRGNDYPVAAEVMTQAQLSKFKHTANSMAAIGDDARHGPTSKQPPSNPMMIGDARNFIRNLLKYWLEEKCGTRLRRQ